LDQRGELILRDFEPFGGFLAIQELGHLQRILERSTHTFSHEIGRLPRFSGSAGRYDGG
jgi:hypothetical protein